MTPDFDGICFSQYYRTFVFDCDGVILDSNQIKTDAFRTAALPYGVEAANALVEHHVATGGISRYAKFEYFVEQILPKYSPGRVLGRDGPGLEALLSTFSREVRIGLMKCGVAEGLVQMRDATPGVRWAIVSGGDQAELREVFEQRGLSRLFDAGIFGSPDTKEVILKREFQHNNIKVPALFLGDSAYDYAAARESGLDFVFISDWTDFDEWECFCHEQKIVTVPSLGELLSEPKACRSKSRSMKHAQ